MCVFYRRGLVYGLWNSHTYVGNILGSLIAGAFLTKTWQDDWGLSFIVPGFIIIGMALLVLLFLTPRKYFKMLMQLAVNCHFVSVFSIRMKLLIESLLCCYYPCRLGRRG